MEGVESVHELKNRSEMSMAEVSAMQDRIIMDELNSFKSSVISSMKCRVVTG